MIAKTIAAALISVGTLAAMPAQASAASLTIDYAGPQWQSYDHGHKHGRYIPRHRLSTDEVRWMLRGHGYEGIRFFDGRGTVYQLTAHKHGERYFLVVGARGGEILSRHRI